MKNPIPKNDMWATLTMPQLQDAIDQLPAGDRALAYHYAIMAMNMCHAAVEQAIAAEPAEAAEV
jgi:hypothetical protein